MERDASDLQAQIDQLNLTLRQWRETQDSPQLEEHLKQLADRCGEMLSRWADTDHRHAHALSELEVRLGEWGSMEHRLEQDSIQRVREFQTTMEREWKTLRELQEAPVQQLREQAAALGETCVAAANLALRGFEQAEARLAALETDLQTKLGQLTLDVHEAIAELKRTALPGAQKPVEPFPLESVMRLHDEVRDDAEQSDPHLPVVSSAAPGQMEAGEPTSVALRAMLPAVVESTAALATRVESLERDLARESRRSRETARDTAGHRRTTRTVLAVVVGGIVVAGGVMYVISRTLDSRIDHTSNQLALAERATESAATSAAEAAEQSRIDTERQLATVRTSSEGMAFTIALLSAPDLIRFSLAGVGTAPHATARILWSRSAGLMLTAVGMPTPSASPTSVYRIWFLSLADPVNVGTFTADATGRVTFGVTNPPHLPNLVTGVRVTEDTTGSPPDPAAPAILVQK